MQVLNAQNHIVRAVADKNIFYVTPVNVAEEKEKFFDALSKQEVYNPQFSYKKILFSPLMVNQQIDLIKSYKGKFQDRFHSIAQRYASFLDLVLSRGSEEFTEYSKELYGFPSDTLVEKATKILSSPVSLSKSEKVFSAVEVKEQFQPLLREFGWRVAISPISSKMRASPSAKLLVVDKDSQFSEADINRLEFHEVRTHVVRFANNQKLPFLIKNLFNYIETEEGLAAYMEKINGCLSDMQLRVYAARLLAIHKALSGSFYEVFSFLKEHDFSDSVAFQITVRVKRGLEDTEKSGGFTRDLIYLSGLEKVEQFIKDGGSLDDLFLGKIAVEDVDFVKSIIKK